MDKTIIKKDYKIWFEDDILWVEYLTDNPGIKGIDEGIKDRLKLINGNSYLTIMDARKIHKASKAALKRSYEKDANEGILACAMVTDKKLPVILFHLIQLAYKTPFELKLFTDIEKAKKWIYSFKK